MTLDALIQEARLWSTRFEGGRLGARYGKWADALEELRAERDAAFVCEVALRAALEPFSHWSLNKDQRKRGYLSVRVQTEDIDRVRAALASSPRQDATMTLRACDHSDPDNSGQCIKCGYILDVLDEDDEARNDAHPQHRFIVAAERDEGRRDSPQ